MTVTWTSGYESDEAYPFVEWGMKWSPPVRSAAGTVTFDRESVCGMHGLYCMNIGGFRESFEAS
jgi:hypothetical protein